MDVIIEARIKGGFRGWNKDRIYALDKGLHKKWQQVADRSQFRSAYQPRARLLRDGSKHYLEVEGMDDMVEVKRA
jgi:hypothetical protein